MTERYCGREGRIARAVLRGNRKVRMSTRDAIDHVWECSCCQQRIDDAVAKNPQTTYVGDSVSEVLRLASLSAGRSNISLDW